MQAQRLGEPGEALEVDVEVGVEAPAADRVVGAEGVLEQGRGVGIGAAALVVAAAAGDEAQGGQGGEEREDDETTGEQAGHGDSGTAARVVAGPESGERTIVTVRRTPVAVLLAALLCAVLAAPTQAAKRPTVRAELQRLQTAGEIDGPTADGYRKSYSSAKATLKKLTGFRRVQLKAVLANVDATAAGASSSRRACPRSS